MPDQNVGRAPAVVMLPAEIDLTNAECACERFDAAVASGAPVVIADFTATTFCDCSSLRRLVDVQHRAAACGVRLRLAIPPGSPVRRLAKLTGLDARLPVYPSLGETAAWITSRTGTRRDRSAAFPAGRD